MTTNPKPKVKSNWPRLSWTIHFPARLDSFAVTWFENSPAGVAAAIADWKRAGTRGLNERDIANYPNRDQGPSGILAVANRYSLLAGSRAK